MAKQKNKPTRKQMNEGIGNLYQGLKYLGEKITYLESYIASVEKAFDLYIKFNKDEDKFMEHIKKYKEEEEAITNKTVEKKDKVD